MRWEHFTAPQSSHVTPQASESNDHSISILTECIGKDEQSHSWSLPAGWLFSTDVAQERDVEVMTSLLPAGRMSRIQRGIETFTLTVTSLRLILKCCWFIKSFTLIWKYSWAFLIYVFTMYLHKLFPYYWVFRRLIYRSVMTPYWRCKQGKHNFVKSDTSDLLEPGSCLTFCWLHILLVCLHSRYHILPFCFSMAWYEEGYANNLSKSPNIFILKQL